jgi:hypothetical protein
VIKEREKAKKEEELKIRQEAEKAKEEAGPSMGQQQNGQAPAPTSLKN